MATRKETAERKAQLRRDLRGARGDAVAGAMAVSQRELARRYGLSQFTVSQELKKLASEGVLHSVERVGTFVGAPTPSAAEFYLLAVHHSPSLGAQERALQDGFEGAIAARGGSVLRMALHEIVARVERDSLPPFGGYFRFDLPHGRRSRFGRSLRGCAARFGGDAFRDAAPVTIWSRSMTARAAHWRRGICCGVGIATSRFWRFTRRNRRAASSIGRRSARPVGRRRWVARVSSGAS